MEVLPHTKYLFRKLLDSKLERATYYYSEFYEGFLPTPEEKASTIVCPTCQEHTPILVLQYKLCFFTIRDMSHQVLQVITETLGKLFNNLEKLNSNPEESISDITDGSVYRKLKASGTLDNDI